MFILFPRLFGNFASLVFSKMCVCVCVCVWGGGGGGTNLTLKQSKHPSVTHPVVPQNFSSEKVKTLRGSPILHRGDLRKFPGLLSCLNKFFKPQIRLETFVPFRQLQENLSVVFYHAKGGGKLSPPPSPAGSGHFELWAQWPKSPDDLEMQHFTVPT